MVSVNVTLVSLAKPVNVMKDSVSTKTLASYALAGGLVGVTGLAPAMWSQCHSCLTRET